MAKDQWSSKAYSDAASFVPVFTTRVIQLLQPHKGDKILDIGCGDGALTAKIAMHCSSIVGLDASPSMIETAAKLPEPNATYYTVDCSRLSHQASSSRLEVLKEASFDKVFSNAAMHWILRKEETRPSFFRDIYDLIKPGGSFVFEMGGPGNVSDAHSAITSVLHCQHNIPISRIQHADPWFFPSENWMRKTLESTGFKVTELEVEYRPTKMTATNETGSGGIEGWIRLMASPFLDLLGSKAERDKAVSSICAVLASICGQPDEDGLWLGYVRLRAAAVKP